MMLREIGLLAAIAIIWAVSLLFGAFLLVMDAPCRPPSQTCFGPPSPPQEEGRSDGTISGNVR